MPTCVGLLVVKSRSGARSARARASARANAFGRRSPGTRDEYTFNRVVEFRPYEAGAGPRCSRPRPYLYLQLCEWPGCARAAGRGRAGTGGIAGRGAVRAIQPAEWAARDSARGSHGAAADRQRLVSRGLVARKAGTHRLRASLRAFDGTG